MNAKSPKTTWMWQDEDSGGVMGAIVNLDERLISWLDQPGCACGDSNSEQTIMDFLASGPRWVHPPEEVEAEMRAELGEFVNASGE